MTSIRTLAAAAVALALAFPGIAYAHAQLQKAVPAVGGVVAAPTEIRLTFSEAVEPRFSSVALSDESGATEPLGPPSVDSADAATLIVKVGKALVPGVYSVKWRAVSVDTHKTQGAFNFTVKP